MQKNEPALTTESSNACYPATAAADYLLRQVQAAIGGRPNVSDLRAAVELLRAAAWLLEQKADKDWAPTAEGLARAFSK